MSLALKFKFISTERWEPKQNERGQAEFKQNKKSYWPKGVKLLKLISRHKKTKKKKKQSERHKYDADHLRVRVRETNANINYFP